MLLTGLRVKYEEIRIFSEKSQDILFISYISYISYISSIFSFHFISNFSFLSNRISL